MSKGVLRVIAIGVLGRDVETKSFSNGDMVANLSVAVGDSYKDKNGEWVNTTEWLNVVVQNQNLVKFCENYLRKSSRVYLEGTLKTEKYQDKNGIDKQVTKVVIGRFNGQLTLLDGKDGEGQSQSQDKPIGGGQSAMAELEDDIPW